MAFEEVVASIVILGALYYIGIIISRGILLSARRQEIELAREEINIKRAELDLLEGEVHEPMLIESAPVEDEKEDEEGPLRVVIGEKVSPKNRW